MKHIFLILLVVVSIGGFGQRKDSLTADNPGNRLNAFTITPKQDTIRCLMLVCDTMGHPHTSVGSLLPSSQAWNEGKVVWWQFGYEVYEMQYGNVPCNDGKTGTNAIAMLCQGWYREKQLSTLDQNKKPLPKSLAVWMSKEIK